jgi:hypothetical protein
MSDRFIHAEDHMRGCLYYGDKSMLFGNDKRGPEERSPLQCPVTVTVTGQLGGYYTGRQLTV